jgi:Fe2+ transport system protein B
MNEDVELGNIELKKKEEPQGGKNKVKTDVSKTEKKLGIVMFIMFLFLIFLVVFIVRLNQGGIEGFFR